MGLFGKSNEEKQAEILNKYNINEGIKGRIIFQEKDIRIKSHGAVTKGLATGAFGLIGLAVSSGVDQEEYNHAAITTFRVADNGLVFVQATNEGKDLRIPWDNILRAEELRWGWGVFPKYNLKSDDKTEWLLSDRAINIILLENQEFVISLSLGTFGHTCKNNAGVVIPSVINIINSNACGVCPQDEGW